jgi:hypothetical protein
LTSRLELTRNELFGHCLACKLVDGDKWYLFPPFNQKPFLKKEKRKKKKEKRKKKKEKRENNILLYVLGH